ncbi:hypothetical protein NC651_028033 [Populus alba x Populus x berolinensis]|nr:hypothetical protein NC651_028033 [Populus alba x Populus x berolinensis]
MEFEGSCPQDAVGLVVVLKDTVHALIRTSFAARLMAAVLGDIYPLRIY